MLTALCSAEEKRRKEREEKKEKEEKEEKEEEKEEMSCVKTQLRVISKKGPHRSQRHT